MSRIGKHPISVPQGVKVQVSDRKVEVSGPKGALNIIHNDKVRVLQEEGKILVQREGETKEHRACHGLYQRLIANMIEGVTNGYKKELEIVGVGYRAQMEGESLVLQVGLSHQPKFVVPQGLKISVPKPTQIVIEGSDKQQVGQVAARIRKIRPPEPYQGKGIRYLNERVRRKVGKTGAK
ncbi:50S ribosomal protein L6 [Candidatus Sumerlaeota bacterium]|nr:50S ribosomal protein L6 [Candidatus Sumerlaeota bacterium]